MRLWRREKPTGGLKARQQAEKSLSRTTGRWPEVREMASEMRDLRERNHFGESIQMAMRGK